jgi:hypothetical protein
MENISAFTGLINRGDRGCFPNWMVLKRNIEKCFRGNMINGKRVAKNVSAIPCL